MCRVEGLHPDEAIGYLRDILSEHEKDDPPRPVYAITGTGHHSKNGRDKIGKAVRAFLNECRYAFREFSVPGDRGNMGGIIGIDPGSWDRDRDRDRGGAEREQDGLPAVALAVEEFRPGESTKIRIMKREDVETDGGN